MSSSNASVATKQADGIELRELLAQIRKLSQRQINEPWSTPR
jgi:hypothetical protein